MNSLETFQSFLSSGADAAMVAFAYFLWKVDRRLLIVEQQIKAFFVRREDDNG